jgi:hypothetical protein
MIKLGVQNVECIKGITNWCKHVRLKQESEGLLGQLTGLPIGMIGVSCPHAAGGSSSVNLPWIVPEFLLQNCVSCAVHTPNGDTKWAAEIISNAKKQADEHEVKKRERDASIERIRLELCSLCSGIAAALMVEPVKADSFLASRIASTHGELQALLVNPYEYALRNHDSPSNESATQQLAIEKMCFARCWEFVKDDKLELKTRIKATEVLDRLCSDNGFRIRPDSFKCDSSG